MRRMTFAILLIFILLALSVHAQTDEISCSVILEEPIETEGYKNQQAITLPVGTRVEFVGQQVDGSAWILRQDDRYLLYPTSAVNIRPVGCIPASWGPPPREYLPLQTVMDEVGITAWHEQGYLGQGVRVGILDTRYDNLGATLAGLPISQSQVTFIPSLAELETLLPQAERTESHHGTNVLEVMAYIAPQAEYVLARSVDAVSFSQAVDDLIAENVQIIVHASNVITSDPTPYHDAVRRADAAGILWINSAGNMGVGYYPARYSGDDIVTVHQFSDPNRAGTQASLMVPVDRNGSAQVTLVWDEALDDEPNDFELVVYGSCNRRDQTTFAPQRSDEDQASGAPTYESVPLSNGLLQQINDYTTIPLAGSLIDCPDEARQDSIEDNEVYVTVLDAVGNAQIDSRFDLYVEGALPAEFDPDISTSLDPVVLVPGDIAESFTVGAYDWRSNRMAWYSGRLNSLQYYELNNHVVDYSVDELVKPDIVTYGELLLPSGREFFGTSAATPLVGAIAVLGGQMLSSGGGFAADGLRQTLNSSWSQCLQNDGVQGRITTKLQLNADGNESQDEHVACGNYEWVVDLSSRYVENFQLPALANITREAQLAQREALAQNLVDVATSMINSSNHDLGLLLTLEAIRVSTENNLFDLRVSALNALLSAINTNPYVMQILHFASDDLSIVNYSNAGNMIAAISSEESQIYVWDFDSQELVFEAKTDLQRVDHVYFDLTDQVVVLVEITDDRLSFIERNNMRLDECSQQICNLRFYDISLGTTITCDPMIERISQMRNSVICNQTPFEFPREAVISNTYGMLESISESAISPNGQYSVDIVPGGVTNAVRNGGIVIKDTTGSIVDDLRGTDLGVGYEREPSMAYFSPDSNTLLFEWNGTIFMWHTPEYTRFTSIGLRRIGGTDSFNVTSNFAVHPSEKLVAFADAGRVIIVNYEDYNSAIAYQIDPIGAMAISDIAISGDGNWIGAVGDGAFMPLILTASGSHMPLQGVDIMAETNAFLVPWDVLSYVADAELNYDGTLIAYLGRHSYDGNESVVIVWQRNELQTDRLVTMNLEERIDNIYFDSENNLFLEFADGSINALDPYTQNIREISILDGVYYNADMSDNRDDLTSFIDSMTGQILGPVYSFHPVNLLQNVSFPADSRILSLGIRSTVAVIESDPAKWAIIACGIANRNLSTLEWDMYFEEVSYNTTCQNFDHNVNNRDIPSNIEEVETQTTHPTPTFIITTTPISARCPGTMESRLIVGSTAQVIPGPPNNLRQEPTVNSNRIGEIPGSATFDVLDGPHCADGYAWWQVSYNGTVGWTAEASSSEYWLEPLR